MPSYSKQREFSARFHTFIAIVEVFFCFGMLSGIGWYIVAEIMGLLDRLRGTNKFCDIE